MYFSKYIHFCQKKKMYVKIFFYFVNLICFIENQTNGLKSKLKVKRFQIPSTDSD